MLLESDWIRVLIYFGILSLLVIISDLLYKKFNIASKITRRVVHIGVGLVICTTPFLLEQWLPPAVLAAVFIIANTAAIKMHKMQGLHRTQRISYGTVFFPITYLILILLFWNSAPEIIVISMLLLTICDPMAAIIGERYGKNYIVFLHDKKSVPGLLGILGGGFILTFFTLLIMVQTEYINSLSVPHTFIIALAIAIIAVPAEALSVRGTDNLSLPLLSATMLAIMLNSDYRGNIINLAWIILSGIAAAGAYQTGSLSKSGAAGALIVGAFIFTIGGTPWLVPLALFFISSSLLSKIGKNKKSDIRNIVKKGGRRDIQQVYANGGVALILAILAHYLPQISDFLFSMYVGSLAAANADTWETEIGTFFQGSTYSIINFKKVPPGTSGGISVLGTGGGLLGAACIALAGILLPPAGFNQNASLYIFVSILLAGLFGSLVDSYIGAVFQAEYLCPECQQKTERLLHCGTTTNLISGWSWINNDLVNFIGTLSGAVLALLLTLGLF